MFWYFSIAFSTLRMHSSDLKIVIGNAISPSEDCTILNFNIFSARKPGNTIKINLSFFEPCATNSCIPSEDCKIGLLEINIVGILYFSTIIHKSKFVTK